MDTWPEDSVARVPLFGGVPERPAIGADIDHRETHARRLRLRSRIACPVARLYQALGIGADVGSIRHALEHAGFLVGLVLRRREQIRGDVGRKGH